MTTTPFNPPRWLLLLLTLLDGNGRTAAELIDILGCEERNFTYMLKKLPEKGIIVERQGHEYFLKPHSPLLNMLYRDRTFTNQQASYIYQQIMPKIESSEQAAAIARKLQSTYDIDCKPTDKNKTAYKDKLTLLQHAIDMKRQCFLKGYSSLHSHKKSDRNVEPYMIIHDVDVRAYVPYDHCCKSFRISRIQEVQVRNRIWQYEDKHDKGFVDIFNYCGEPNHHIQLELGFNAHQLLLEQYPQSASAIKPHEHMHWLLETDVVSYDAVVRFILGSFDDLRVLGDSDLKHELHLKIIDMKNRTTL